MTHILESPNHIIGCVRAVTSRGQIASALFLLRSAMATAQSQRHCYCQRRRSYKQMVQDIAENLGAEDVQKIVFCHDLPAEFSGKPALAALRQLEVQGQFSDADTERLESLLRGIHRYDLINRHVMHYRRHHCGGDRGIIFSMPNQVL